MLRLVRQNLLYLAWLQALVATAGSLYFSEIMHLVPCVLCWYQRILMYPLVLILAVGVLRKERSVVWYALPQALLGMGIALFHYLLQMGVIPDRVAPCVAGISCTTKLIEYFGFVTIPLMSLIAFTVISILLIFLAKQPAKSA